MCVNDEPSPPVESVLKTRQIDSNDLDLEKVIPFQNYFSNKDLLKNQHQSCEMEVEPFLVETKQKCKSKRKDLDKESLGLVASKIDKKKLIGCDEASTEKCKETILKHFNNDLKSVLN